MVLSVISKERTERSESITDTLLEPFELHPECNVNRLLSLSAIQMNYDRFERNLNDSVGSSRFKIQLLQGFQILDNNYNLSGRVITGPGHIQAKIIPTKTKG